MDADTGRESVVSRAVRSRSPFTPAAERPARLVPGWIGTALVGIATTFWAFWGGLELFHEAWWGPVAFRFMYLAPLGVSLALAVALQAFPRVGAVLSAGVGLAFTAWWTSLQLQRGGDFFSVLTSMPFSGSFVVIAVLFWMEGLRRARGGAPWRWRWWATLLPPLAMLGGIVAIRAPVVLMRVDDGDYGERRIVGNGVDLVWAGAGDGWSPGLDPNDLFGPVDVSEAPTWDQARDLCAALEPAGTWRLPTSDELVRSLVRGGENAGCEPPEGEGDARCARLPEKETPLWRPNASPIYLWSADDLGEEARYVSFNGWVRSQPKPRGNSRHGYRCVREP